MLPPRQGSAGFGAAAPAPGPAPAGPTPPPGVAADPAAAQAAGEPQPNVSPEEQQIYNDFVGMALMHLYDEATMPSLVKKLQATGKSNHVQAVGETAALIAYAVFQKSIDAGSRVPEYIMAHAGREIVSAVGEVAERAGLPALSQQDVDGAYYVAADEVRGMMEEDGLVDEAVVDNDMMELEDMEASGQLGGLLEAMGGSPDNAPPPEAPADPAAAPAAPPPDPRRA